MMGKDLQKAFWGISGFSAQNLKHQIGSNLYERQGKAITNDNKETDSTRFLKIILTLNETVST